MSFTLDDQIRCVAREIALRENCYPKWTAVGRIRPEAAFRELETMKEVLRTLEKLKDPCLPLLNT